MFDVPLEEEQATRICSILHKCPTLIKVSFYVGDALCETAKPLAKFLRESVVLKILVLKWNKVRHPPMPHFRQHREQVPVPNHAIAALFNAMAQSASLQHVMMRGEPAFGNVDLVAKSLTSAVTRSVTIETVESVLSRQYIHRVYLDALFHTQAVRGLDLCYRKTQETLVTLVVSLNRRLPWKPLLSQNIQPALWPRILAMSILLKEETSHSPVDALYLLIKEKSDVLLQNVHRRKIQKRKRYQISK